MSYASLNQNLKNLARKINLIRTFVDSKQAVHTQETSHNVATIVGEKINNKFSLEHAIKSQAQLESKALGFVELLELAKKDSGSFSIAELQDEFHSLSEVFDQHFNAFLSTIENASSPCLMTLTAGAGGVDSDDFVNMLTNMYQRHGLRHQRQVRCIDASQRSTILEIQGPFAYAWYLQEQGIHRLIRLNSSNIRHTAFASISVTPTLPEVPLHIDEHDLEIQTLKSSGKGGQHANKTESAIRISHLPSGITIKCQQERSQYSNKLTAMKILRHRLLQKRIDEEQALNAARRQSFQPNRFGSQIRSYILHPYTMVKDHVTGLSTNQLEQVLLGETELDCFLEAQLFLKEGPLSTILHKSLS